MDTLTWSLTILILGVFDQCFPLGSSLAELRLAGSEKRLQKRKYIINNGELTSSIKIHLSISEGRIQFVHEIFQFCLTGSAYHKGYGSFHSKCYFTFFSPLFSTLSHP